MSILRSRLNQRAWRLPAIGILVFLVSFGSFYANLFRVVTEESRAIFQLDSEQLLLDGLLNIGADGRDMGLGVFSRPGLSVEENWTLAEQHYIRQDRTGPFVQYPSQYGLQLKILKPLYLAGIRDLATLKLIPVTLLALVLAGLYMVLDVRYSTVFGLAFVTSLIFSPWLVLFADNLYWFAGLWLIPLLTVFALRERFLQITINTVAASLLLLLAFVTKMLSGYEYVTTVGVASVLPIVLAYAERVIDVKQMIKSTLLILGTFLVAFSLSLFVHLSGIQGNPGENRSAAEILASIGAKRLSSENPTAIIEEVCRGRVVPCSAETRGILLESLQADVADLVVVYSIGRNMLPWLNTVDPGSLPRREKDAIKQAVFSPSLATVTDLLKELSIPGYRVVLELSLNAVLPAVLLGLLLGFCVRKKLPRLAFLQLVSLGAPLSWVILAKGHSYIHDHMNFVVWFIVFVPLSVALIVQLHRHEQLVSAH